MQFSVVIPAKNEFKDLTKMVPQFDAVKKKFALEVIVADGQSTDGTIELARKLADKVEVKTKQERETIGEGRNRGAKVAQGDILVFVDAAVMIEKPMLFFETIHKLFEDPQIVAAIPRVNIDPGLANWQDRFVHSLVNFLVWFQIVVGIGAGKGECQVIRRTAFEIVGGYDETLVAGEDSPLIHKVIKHGRVMFLKELQVFDDPRRYRKLGYPRVIFQWVRNAVYVNFFHRSYDKEWKRVD